MSRDDKSRGLIGGGDPQHQSPNYYGTFQGVANYYNPPPPPPPPQPQLPQPVIGFPQPAPPPGSPGYPQCYHYGYQTVGGYAVVEGTPIREPRLPCCGIGIGWFLFLIGFFLGGIPWYLGAFLLICTCPDRREKPGYVACAIASFLAVLAVTVGATRGPHRW
ncbi:hypothetical protein ACJRO7_017048 [Eucalyptus globulus]|uniref:60S ribosomal protein L18a-like protein n=1 Tax=Eucalyptus globulus TaxID=34317 RepID=A0ABD3KNU9_EUCGL